MEQRKISTALIGFGLSGKLFHAPFLHANPAFSLDYVVERNSSESKVQYPDVVILNDFEELLKMNDFEIAVLAVPNIFHYPMAKALLESGRNVIVEKPFTPTASEADELIRMAESLGKHLFVYQNRRWDGDFLTVTKILNEGLLGEVVHYEAHFDRYAPGMRRSAWRDQPLPAGGVLYDLGSHLIDQAMVLFGAPQAVFADIGKQRELGNVDDYFDLKLYYGRLTVNLRASLMVREPGPRYLVHGRLGSFVKYGTDPQEERLKQGWSPEKCGFGADHPENYGILHTEKEGGVFKSPVVTEAGNYMMFYDDVANVIRSGAPPAVKSQEARQVIRIIELAFESHAKRSVIPFS
jgi:scyllo-inositol 2-dehydrogenase (NADP+)